VGIGSGLDGEYDGAEADLQKVREGVAGTIPLLAERAR
jgi:hypothetical protein